MPKDVIDDSSFQPGSGPRSLEGDGEPSIRPPGFDVFHPWDNRMLPIVQPFPVARTDGDGNPFPDDPQIGDTHFYATLLYWWNGTEWTNTGFAPSGGTPELLPLAIQFGTGATVPVGPSTGGGGAQVLVALDLSGTDRPEAALWFVAINVSLVTTPVTDFKIHVDGSPFGLGMEIPIVAGDFGFNATFLLNGAYTDTLTITVTCDTDTSVSVNRGYVIPVAIV